MSDVREANAPAPAGRSGTNPAGDFIWYELMTTDADAAGRFYSAIVPGWKFGSRMPGDVDYRGIERSDGGNAGGILQLDDSMRSMLTDRCELQVLFAGDVLIEEGKVPDGLYIVGGGTLELVAGGAVQQTLGPGDLPFPSAVLTHDKASATVRAAASGALVLHADRMTTHELIVSLPPLLELLSMS